MRKLRYLGVVMTSVGAILATSSAFAAQNVANTSQKGSLLVWPLITVDPNGPSSDTQVEISNDSALGTHVECEYVNEGKGRVNFDFFLSGKGTASWDVRTLASDHAHPAAWPTNFGSPAFPGNLFRGSLTCFATDAGRKFQIAHNHLTGTATVLALADQTAAQPRQAFRYNAWAFVARDAAGLPAADNPTVSHGTAGRLDLTGDGQGSYDACPAYNIANFMPNGARLGNVKQLSNTLSVVSCNIDLREKYVILPTKLDFTVWNAAEHSFTGAYACKDGISTVPLAPTVAGPTNLVNGSNFDRTVLRTRNARFQVRGISASPPCTFGTVASGLLGVLQGAIAIAPGPFTASHALVGNTTQGAGVQPGFVLWDPEGDVPKSKRK